jgi:hypothetical protein
MYLLFVLLLLLFIYLFIWTGKMPIKAEKKTNQVGSLQIFKLNSKWLLVNYFTHLLNK